MLTGELPLALGRHGAAVGHLVQLIGAVSARCRGNSSEHHHPGELISHPTEHQIVFRLAPKLQKGLLRKLGLFLGRPVMICAAERSRPAPLRSSFKALRISLARSLILVSRAAIISRASLNRAAVLTGSYGSRIWAAFHFRHAPTLNRYVSIRGTLRQQRPTLTDFVASACA